MKTVMKIEDREYISSGRAAEMTHYTNDYIGQLCRGGKLSARMIGRSWFIEIESLTRYQEAIKEQLHKEKKSQSVHRELAAKKSPVVAIKSVPAPFKQEVEVEKERTISTSFPVFPQLAWKIAYAEDDRSLLPVLNKKVETPRSAAIKVKKTQALISEQVKSIFQVSQLPEGFGKLAVVVVLVIGAVTVSATAAIDPNSFQKNFLAVKEFTTETLGSIDQTVSMVSGVALSMTWSDFGDALDVALNNTVKPVATAVVALVPDVDMSKITSSIDLSLPRLPELPSFSIPDISLPHFSMPHFALPDLSLPTLSFPTFPDVTPTLAAVGDVWDSSVTWVSDVFGSATRKIVALVTFPQKIVIVQEQTTSTPQSVAVRTPIAPQATSSVIAVVSKPALTTQTIFSNTERIIEPRTTIINAVDAAILQRIVNLESYVATGFLVSRPFLSRQSDAIADSSGRAISALDTRVAALEADSGGGGGGSIDTSTANTWTALQQFQGGASTTIASIYNALYVGTTATTTILGNATSTFGAGIQSTYLNITGTGATSTFANGINLSGGCFSINGTCISGGGGASGTVNSGTLGQVAFYAANGTAVSGTSTLVLLNENIGIGTTSPYAKLSVVGQAVAAYFTATTTTASTFPYASTTALTISGTGYFPNNGIWTSAGFLGIGTTSPYAALSVVGEAVARNFTATSTTATSTFAGGFNANSGAIVSDFTTGITSISSLETGSMSFDTDAGVSTWMDLTVTSAAADTPQSYTALLDGNPMLTIYGESTGTGIVKKTAVGIGSSTPFALLSIQNNAYAASSTYSFFIASTTAAFATTTQFVVTNAGNVGIGTSSPYAALSVVGEAVARNFTATSTTATSTFAGAFSVGSTTPGGNSLFSVGTSSPLLTVNKTTGFVGIGSANPSAALDVNGSLTALGVSVNNIRLDYNTNQVFATGMRGNTSALQFTSNAVAGATDYIAFSVNTGNAQTEAMRIVTSGNVGIGTTSPYAKLSVVGQAVAAYFTATTTTASTFPYASTTALTISGTGYFPNNGIWTSAGFLGIGTTSPYAALSVVGEAVARNFTATSTTATSTFAGGFNANSGAIVSDFTTGITSISSLEMGGSFFEADAGALTWTDLSVTSSAPVDTPQSYTAFLDGNPMLTIYGESTGTGIVKKTAVGIGSSTPFALLSIQNNAYAASSTYSFFIASTTAAFATTTQFVVTNAGNVGIGTSSPERTLTVNGSGLFARADASPQLLVRRSGSVLQDWAFSVGSAGQFTIEDRTGVSLNPFTIEADTPEATLYLDSTGNVGIGTTSPYAKLSVVGQAVAAYFTATTTTASTFPYASTTALTISGTGYFPNNGIWTSAGFLGIGTTSPYAALSVVGEAVARNFTATSTTATSTFAGGFNANSGAIVSDFTTGITSISSLETGSMSFDTDAGMVSWNDLSVTSAAVDTPQGYIAFLDGNPMLTIYGESTGTGIVKKTAVGIGSSTPFALLSIQNNAYAASSTYSFFIASTTAAFATTTQFVVTNAGNVGIGTSTPWRTLSVNGTAAFTGLTNDSTGYYVCLNTTSYNLSTSTSACGASSQRFKENVQNLSYGLNVVNQLKPVSFDWKADFMPRSTGTSTRQIGFIAEEVAALIPELATYDSTGQVMNLDYPKLTAVLVNAIQQQQLQINSLIAATTTTASVDNAADYSNIDAPQTALEVLTAKVNELNLRMDIFASTTATSTLVATSSPEFIESVANSVRDLVQSAGEWVVQKITATLAIFQRVETQTAAIKNGLEITDSVTGEIWCMRIAAGEWDKTKGSCAAPVLTPIDTSTSTPSIVIPTGSGDVSTATSTLDAVISNEIDDTGSSTLNVITGTPPDEPLVPSVGETPTEPVVPVAGEMPSSSADVTPSPEPVEPVAPVVP